jgi:hypothetical protein
MALHKLSLCDLQKKFTAGEVTAVEIVRAYALRIGQVESKVKAYVTPIKDAALQHAAELDTRLKGWRKTRPLTGMPLAIKDNLCTESVPTTCASRMLQQFIPRTMRRSSPSCENRTTFCWARRISMNSPWDRQPNTPPSARAAIPGTSIVCRAVRAEDRPLPWLRMNVWQHSV